MNRTYKLILQTGTNAGAEFVLEKDEIFLGRDVNNDVVINDPEVSRRHARLIRDGEEYLYEDLGSTNGTFIQGQRLAAPTLLKHGTIITIGERVLLSYMIAMTDPYATVAVSRVSQPVEPLPQAQAVPQSSPLPQKASVVPPPPPLGTPPLQTPPSYVPPVYSQPPAFKPPIPQQPPAVVQMPPPPAPDGPKKKSKGLLIILIILGVLLVFCIIPWIIVEITNSYCSLFPGFFNAIQAGACP